jgi:hypothetical protein
MNESQRATYRALIEKEFEAMREAVQLWERQDITRDERIKLFNQAYARIRQLEQETKQYVESIIGPIRPDKT